MLIIGDNHRIRHLFVILATMKSLSLNRPLAIMMLGHPGAGKSFFARQFAETFNAPMVSMDRIRYELFAEPQFSKDEETIISRVSMLQIEQLFKTHKTFLIDGGMSARTDRGVIEQLARKHDYGTLVIWIQTDPVTARTRSMRRNPKRVFDEYNAALSAELHTKLSQRLTPPSPRETVVVVSGKHTYATQVKIVLKKLVSPREEAVTAHPAKSTPVAPASQGDDRPSPPIRRSVTIR